MNIFSAISGEKQGLHFNEMTMYFLY